MLFLLLGLVLAAGVYASSSEPEARALPSGDDDVARNAARELSILGPVILALQKQRRPITAEALTRVKNLQAQIGAFPDGIIGPETMGRMRALGFPLDPLGAKETQELPASALQSALARGWRADGSQGQDW